MTIPSTFTLLDGKKIPVIGWGNGSGNARTTAVVSGEIALKGGLRHIDTAQGYGNEKETGLAITNAGFSKADIWVTSKLSQINDSDPIPLADVRSSVQETIARLGFQPDLLLVHNPFVAEPGKLVEFWQILEDMKDKGELTSSIGVSNFRPQDLEAVLKVAKYKPVVNQLEYHPFVLSHLAPVLAIQSAHGIVTEAYGPLTPVLRHPSKGGPLKPILARIAERLTKEYGKPITEHEVLLLWTIGSGAVAVSASGNEKNIKKLGEVFSAGVPALTEAEVKEIAEVGKKIHFRHYTEHMEVKFPTPDLPVDL